VGCTFFTKVLLQVATAELCLDLDVANLIIFISKNGEENSLEITIFCGFFPFSIAKLRNFSTNRNSASSKPNRRTSSPGKQAFQTLPNSPFWLAMYSQNDILKIKSSKIMVFTKFNIQK
jgi:hypothetical protein